MFEYLGTGNPAKCLVKHAVRPAVAIMERIGDQGALPVEEAKVYPPGVDADAGQVWRMLPHSQGDGLLDLTPQAQDVPMQAIWQAHRFVGKAVNFGKLDPISIELAQQSPATLRTQV